MDAKVDKFWSDFLARLPEAERSAGLSLVRQIGEGGQGNVMAGLLALQHAGGLAYLDAAERLARAADAQHRTIRTRHLEWLIVALLVAMVVAPFTWWLRGMSRPAPLAPDLVSLAVARGGQVALAEKQDGSLFLAVRGGAHESVQGWDCFTFPAPVKGVTR